MIQKLPLTKAEYREQGIHSDTLELAAKLFRCEGCLYLENIYSPDFIEVLHKAYCKRHQHCFQDKPSNQVYLVGEKRYKIAIELSSPFDSSLLCTHPLILAVIKHLLGDDVILASFSSVTSLPSAPDQHRHRDHPMLFGAAIDVIIPCYAIKLIIPLVKLDNETGTTRMWPGTHLNLDNTKHQDSIDLQVPTGDCILMDYRLSHQGLANQSKQVRPILYVSYTRPWFQDFKNFKQLEKLKLNKKTTRSLRNSISFFAKCKKT